MTETPSPAELAAQRRARAEAEKAEELARVRKRARLRTHVDDETLRALGRLTFPVKRRKGKRR